MKPYLIFDLGIIILLLLLFWRTTFVSRERKRVKENLSLSRSETTLSKYRQLVFFEIGMYILLSVLFFYYVSFFLIDRLGA